MEKEQPVTAPIKDLNNDGVLTSKELIEQLKTENEKGFEHTANERVQGVLEHLGLRDKLKEFNARTQIGSISTAEDMIAFFETVAEDLTADMKQGAASGKKLLQRDPKYREKMDEHLVQQASQEGGNMAKAGIQSADFNNFLDFAVTFDKTFAKGIKLEWQDMPALLSQIGKLDLPKAVSEKKGQER